MDIYHFAQLFHLNNDRVKKVVPPQPVYYMVLNNTIQYNTILYNIIKYCIVFYSIEVLFITIKYYIVMHNSI